MSNNIVKHDQLKDIAGDLWTKAKKRDIERFEYDSGTKTIKGKNSTDATLSINVELTDLVSINDRAKFKQDVSVDSAASINNLHIGTLNGAHNRDRFSGCRSMTSKSFVDGYVNHLLVVLDDALNVNDPTNWKVWAIKKGTTRNADVVFKAYHTNALIPSTVQQYTIQNQTVKCAKITIDEEFRDEVYFIVQCNGQPVRVMTNLPPEHAGDVVNLSKAPGNTPNSTIDWNQYNADQNMVALCLVGRESITSLAEKLRKTQADGIVTKVNNIAPGADGNVTVTAEHIKTAASSTTNVKQELDKKISNITLKTGDNKKLTVTKADGQNSDVDLTEAFKSENISYTGTIGGTAKNNVKEAIDALNEEAKKGVKKINNGTPDDQGNIAVTVNQTGTTGITMSFGANGDAPVIVATYMTQDEVNQIKGLFT